MRPERRSLAVERTALGWQRSSLSLAVIAALLLANGVRRDEPLGIAGAVVVALGAGLVATSGNRLYRRRLAATPLRAAAGPLLGLVVVTLAAAAVAAAELVGGR